MGRDHVLYGNTSPHLWEQLSGSTTCLEHSQDTGSNQPKKKKKGFEQLNCKVQSLWLLFLREFLRGNSELFIFRCDSKSLVFGFQTKCRGRKYFKYAHLWWWWCDSQQLQAGRRQMISWRYWTQKESFGILIVVANLSAHCVFSATLMCQEKVVRLPWWHSG